MAIDTSLSTVPIASLAGIGYYEGNEKVLFSTHSIFRIDGMKTIDGSLVCS